MRRARRSHPRLEGRGGATARNQSPMPLDFRSREADGGRLRRFALATVAKHSSGRGDSHDSCWANSQARRCRMLAISRRALSGKALVRAWPSPRRHWSGRVLTLGITRKQPREDGPTGPLVSSASTDSAGAPAITASAGLLAGSQQAPGAAGARVPRNAGGPGSVEEPTAGLPRSAGIPRSPSPISRRPASKTSR